MSAPASRISAFYWNNGQSSIFLQDQLQSTGGSRQSVGTGGHRDENRQALAAERTVITGTHRRARGVEPPLRKRRVPGTLGMAPGEMGRPPYEIDLDQLRQYRACHTLSETAAHFGVSRSTVGYRLRGQRRTTG